MCPGWRRRWRGTPWRPAVLLRDWSVSISVVSGTSIVIAFGCWWLLPCPVLVGGHDDWQGREHALGSDLGGEPESVKPGPEVLLDPHQGENDAPLAKFTVA